MALIREIEQVHMNRTKIGVDLSRLFDGELNPVAPKAQRKVPVPSGFGKQIFLDEYWFFSLDLNIWINEPLRESSSSESDETEQSDSPRKHIRSEFSGFGGPPTYDNNTTSTNKKYEPTPDEIFRVYRFH